MLYLEAVDTNVANYVTQLISEAGGKIPLAELREKLTARFKFVALEDHPERPLVPIVAFSRMLIVDNDNVYAWSLRRFT